MSMKLATAYSFTSRWGKLISLTAGAQALMQGIGFLGGLYVIHMLSTEQFAYYTLANTMLGTMVVLADGGISSGVVAEGGKVWRDKQKMGQVLATGMKMRGRFALLTLAVALPALLYLLTDKGMNVMAALLLIVCLIPSFLSALSATLLKIVPRLHQQINGLLMIDLGTAASRLFLMVPVLFFFPFAAVAIFITGLAQVGANVRLRRLAKVNADWEVAGVEKYRKRIWERVKRILPGSIYYCISGQITIWLVAIFNSTEGIAQVGALSRLMMVLTVLRLTIGMIVVPRYARLPALRKTVILRYFQTLALVLLMGAGLVLLIYLFPGAFLLVLGSKYAGLEQEVVLMAMGSCLMTTSGIGHMMSSSRGIIPNPAVFIPYIIAAQVVTLIFLVDYGSVAGILRFTIFTALFTLAFRFVHFLWETLSDRRWVKLTEE